MHRAAIEELAAHFTRAASSSMAAGEEVVQMVDKADEAEEPNDAPKGIVKLCGGAQTLLCYFFTISNYLFK
jgi:hypothetical protein